MKLFYVTAFLALLGGSSTLYGMENGNITVLNATGQPLTFGLNYMPHTREVVTYGERVTLASGEKRTFNDPKVLIMMIQIDRTEIYAQWDQWVLSLYGYRFQSLEKDPHVLVTVNKWGVTMAHAP